MHANFDLDWVIYTAGHAAETTWHRVRNTLTDEVIEYEPGKHKKDVIAELEADLGHEGAPFDRKFSDMYEFLDKGRTAEPLPIVLHTAKRLVHTVFEDRSFDSASFFISPTDGSNWRHTYAKEAKYKGNRDASAKPLLYKEIHDYLVKKFNPTICYGFEADDYVSYYQTENTVLIDNDKDTDMVEGWHYNPRKKEAYYVDKEEAQYNFYRQLLTGDTADNIKGCLQGADKKNCFGNSTADKYLAEYPIDSLEEVVYNKYIEVYGDKAIALMVERGNLLWMPRPGQEVWIPSVVGVDPELLPKKESLDVL